ncbi:MAG: glutamate mutase L, partial [Bacilli bacterium]|nr:glutamate mutase L [Bacilli bacterium]
MSKYLMIDFGSTFTKLTAVDTETEDVIATSAHFTTVATDITIGYQNALNELYKKIGEEISFDKVIACSSAAGGLRMAAIGLVEELTVEAAKRVCLGAGAKVDLVFSHHLTNGEIDSIVAKNIDIILLAGGTDGGNTECAIYNCKALGEKGIKIPVVFAGNKCCVDEILEIFDKYQMNGYICENVMPKINVLNLPSARETIRGLFLNNIIEAKGIKKIEKTIDKVILPTPEAVLAACELLSKGYMHESGLGEIILVDIGGATTDFYSMCSPSAKRSDVILKGLEEPYAKRTVEGDLGMRYSATGIAATLSQEEKRMYREDQGIDIDEEAKYRNTNVDVVFSDQRGKDIDTIFAGICSDKAISRHVGIMEEVYTPMGILYSQTGKDLSQVAYVLGTGGV